MEKQHRQQWWQSVDITTEEEYSQVISMLADELQGEHTPKEIAEIAASHMLYANVLERFYEERKRSAELEDKLMARKEVERSMRLIDAVRKKDARKRMAGLQALNIAKTSAIARAQAIATELWLADTAQRIRTGEMANKVYGVLVDEGLTGLLPELPEGIKDWIKAIAPSYARKGGRPRKTP